MPNEKLKKIFSLIAEYALYLFVFLIPWQARYFISRSFLGGQEWEFAGVSVYVTEVLLWFLILLAFLIHVVSSQEEWHYKGRRAMNLFLMSGTLVIVAFGFAFFAVDKGAAFFAVFRLFEGVALLFILNELKYSVHTMAWWIVASAAIQSVLGIAQFYSQQIGASTLLGISQKLPAVAGISVIETVGGRFLRAYGMFPHPNIFAAFLIIGLFASLGLLLAFRSKWERYAILFVTPIIAAGLFLTFSRTAALVLLIGVVTVGIYLVANSMQSLMALMLRWLFALVLPLLLFGFLHKDLVFPHYFSPELIAQSASVTDRISQYQAARELIAEYWLTGVGIGNYTQALFQKSAELTGGQLQPVHNILLLSLVELGIFGAAVFISLLVEIIKVIIRFKVNYSQELLVMFNKFEATKGMYDKDYSTITHWYVIFSALMIGLLVWFFFDHFFWTLYPGIMMFWLALGLWVRMLIRTKS